MSLQELYQRPGFLLRRAHQISAAVFERACAELGLTPAQFGVLSVLAEQPGIDQSSLARALAFDKVTVLRVLQGLERRGLCTRESVAGQRRLMAVTLSAAGEQLLRQARKPVQDTYEMLMSPFTAEERAQFVGLLHTFIGSLEEQARASFVPVPGKPLARTRRKAA